MRALTKGVNVMSYKESLVQKKKTTIMKFRERLDHGNRGGYILAARIYTSPNNAKKTDKGGKIRTGNYQKSGRDNKGYIHHKNQMQDKT